VTFKVISAIVFFINRIVMDALSSFVAPMLTECDITAYNEGSTSCASDVSAVDELMLQHTSEHY